MNQNPDTARNWRDYQRDLQSTRKTKKVFRERLHSIGPWVGGLVFVFAVLCYMGSSIFANRGLGAHLPEPKMDVEKKAPEKISRFELSRLLENMNIGLPPVSKNYTVSRNGSPLAVETSIVPPLQGYLNDLLGRSLTLRAAAVVLKPATGEILAFSEHRNGPANGTEGNLCLTANHPAASLFKIVAAAAAIDARGLTPETSLTFRGGKYTLYRSQLKPEKKPTGMTITLRNAFASSINPVFGKVGIYHLGYSLLTEYADRFFFNRPIPFDLPLAMSSMEVPTDDFALAEVASGYNKRTFISPLHAAMLSAAVANSGNMMAPRLINKVEDLDGNVLYRSEPVQLSSPVSDETAKKMRILMDETVMNGTCRNAFRNFLRKQKFRELELGAKTGTINDPFDQHRVDWVTVYAIPDSGKEDAISLSVLAVHGEKLGIRSKDIARRLVETYFSS